MVDKVDRVNILSLNNDDTGVTFYRIRTPLMELAKHGHGVRLPSPAPDTDYRATGPMSAAQSASRLPTDEDLDWADVIVGRQLSHPDIVPLWDRWAAFAPLVYETDDDLFAVDTTNPALSAYLHPGVEDAMRHMIRTASLVTVTTLPLARRMIDEGAGRVVELPNYIDRSVLTLPGIRDTQGIHEPLTLGWAGSTSHVGDWMACGKPIREWVLAHPEVDFHLVGTDYRPLLEVPARFTPWARTADYYQNLDFDIGLAPLAPTQFNRCKSPVKALEMAARGIPVVASAGTAYDQFVEHGTTGFLIEDPADWQAYLEWLVQDAATRRTMGEAAHDVARRWTIQENYVRWESAYQLLV